VLVTVDGCFGITMIAVIAVIIQANVQHSSRGRVMALYLTVTFGTVPLGALFAGIVAETWGSPAAFLFGGAVAIVAAGLAGLAMSAREIRST
jgi:hypothetical protein